MDAHPPLRRRDLIQWSAAAALGMTTGRLRAQAAPTPVRVGLTAELKMVGSTSDDAVRLGLALAIEDLNAAGGVLGGRPWQLEVRDDRSVPSRGTENLRELAGLPDLVAVFGSRFSPVMVEMGAVAPQVQCPVISPWAASNSVIDAKQSPGWVFRVSLNDTWAMRRLLHAAQAEGHKRLGLLLPNSGWGRSCHEAAVAQAQGMKGIELLPERWYNWGGEKSLIEHYAVLRQAGMQALILVANEPEGALVCKELLGLPANARAPVYSHWGIAGGDFPSRVGPGFEALDLKVVQTTALQIDRSPKGLHLLQRAAQRMGVAPPHRLPSLVGLGQAYDAMGMVHRAVQLAGSTRREAVREALEHLPPFDGVVRRYAPAFTPQRHEALSETDVILARWDDTGALRALPSRG